jgi:tRNA(Ile)-lysidine synthetase-like protein
LGAPDPRLSPAVAAIRSAVRADLGDLDAGALVLVACSGGADSLALAAATAFVAPRARLRAGAVVVDHGWFASSADVADAAGRACSDLGLAPVDVVRADCCGPGGPEAAARSARYAALDDAARRHGAAAVLLGHTLDDQAETVLLALSRGSGTRSLAGRPARRGLLRRPLLGLPRSTTAAACADLGLPTWSDPANEDPAYLRTRVRGLLPGLDDILGPGLPQTAQTSRMETGAGVELDVAVLAAAPDAVRRRALLLAARLAGSPPGSLGRVHVLAVDAMITRWRGQGTPDLPGGVRAVRACGRLVLARR